MTAAKADTGAAHENPLIPNARLRQIYLAMARAQMVGRSLPPKKRGGWTPGMAACLVSTSIDLGPGDVVSDAVHGGVVGFLRGEKIGRNALADCGAARRLPEFSGIAQRMWAAAGAAAALKATCSGALGPVAVLYVRAGEVSAAQWRNVLSFALEKTLPLVLVVMPGDAGVRAGGVCALAHACGVPGIAVDGDDAVAIYRVAQESFGRARAADGAVVMECVPFSVSASKSKRAGGDAVAAMEQYLLQRGVVTKAWIDQETRSFARRLESKKT